MKVMTILGTRPEIIRLSRVIALLDAHLTHVLVHTGQNWDPALSDVFFDELGLRAPDRWLGAGGGSLAEGLAAIMTGTEAAIADERPDAVLILGDTNSALSAIVARRMKVPVYHMEAGNRCFDRNVPEETNRRIVDHVADFNLVYTDAARRHLIAEGLPHRRIVRTGSPMREVIEHAWTAVEGSDALERLGLRPRGYLLASLHREENVDPADRLGALLRMLGDLAGRHAVPVLLSVHPRTRARLDAGGIDLPEGVRAHPPFGFHDWLALQRGALCTVSDSGTVAEESAILRVPAVTPRGAIERPEALDAGAIALAGTDADAAAEAVDLAIALPRAALPEGYEVTDCAARVLRLIQGTAGLSNAWDGIR